MAIPWFPRFVPVSSGRRRILGSETANYRGVRYSFLYVVFFRCLIIAGLEKCSLMLFGYMHGRVSYNIIFLFCFNNMKTDLIPIPCIQFFCNLTQLLICIHVWIKIKSYVILKSPRPSIYSYMIVFYAKYRCIDASHYDDEMVNKVGRLTVSKNYDAGRNDYAKKIACVAYLHIVAQMKYSQPKAFKSEKGGRNFSYKPR